MLHEQDRPLTDHERGRAADQAALLERRARRDPIQLYLYSIAFTVIAAFSFVSRAGTSPMVVAVFGALLLLAIGLWVETDLRPVFRSAARAWRGVAEAGFARAMHVTVARSAALEPIGDDVATLALETPEGELLFIDQDRTTSGMVPVRTRLVLTSLCLSNGGSVEDADRWEGSEVPTLFRLSRGQLDYEKMPKHLEIFPGPLEDLHELLGPDPADQPTSPPRHDS